MFETIRATGWIRIKQSWITAVLAGGVLLSWSMLLSGSPWPRDPDMIVFMLICGACYGALSAASCFRGRTAVGMNLVVSIGLALLTIGRIVPAPAALFSQSLEKSIWLMNTRLLTLLDVLRADLQWVSVQHLTNTQQVMLIYACIAWSAAAWFMWCLIRRRRALPGVLLIALLIAVQTGLTSDTPQVPVVFIALSVLLMARTAYTGQLHDWLRRGRDFPDLIGEDWTVAAAILTVIVVLLAGSSTPEWRASFQRFIESLRPPPPTESRPVQVTIKPQTENYVDSFVPSLGYVGEPFPDSDEAVFYVSTSDAPSGVDSSGQAKAPLQQHYWRGAIYGAYTGTGWEPLSMKIDAPLAVTATMPLDRYELTQKFEIIALRDSRLFAASQPMLGGEYVTIRTAEGDPTARLPRGIVPNYEVTSWAPRMTVQQLKSDSTEYPAEIRERYLQLPDSVPMRVTNLAERVTHGATSPYDKALRIQEYLRATYPYKLDAPAPPRNRDVVDYFLFDAPGGFCSYYASAMTVMLRSQGVPARLVVGFATGDYDGRLLKYRVPAKAAHAWVEVYFPTYGWIEFEPTPARSTFDYAAGNTPPIDVPEPDRPASSIETSSTPIVLGASLVLLIGVTAVVAITLRRAAAESRLAPEVQARQLYWRTRRSLQQVGIDIAISATPDEFRAACADRLADQPRLRHALEAVTELYIRAVFTDAPPLRSDVDTVRGAWRSTWRDRLKLRWHKLLAR